MALRDHLEVTMVLLRIAFVMLMKNKTAHVGLLALEGTKARGLREMKEG